MPAADCGLLTGDWTRNLLHKILPEWKEIKSGRIPLDYREILRAGELPPETIEEIESELDNLRLTESVLRVA